MLTINEKGEVRNESVTGTAFVGEIVVSYQKLVEVFGEPNGLSGEYKTDAEWEIMTPAGIATIYNWKNGHNYNGEGMEFDLQYINDWNVGGRSKEVLDYINKALGLSYKGHN